MTKCLNNKCTIKGMCKRFHSGRLEHGFGYVCYKPVDIRSAKGQEITCAEFVDKYKPVTDSEK